MNPCFWFLVLQQFGALQTSLLKHNHRLKQRDSLPLATFGRWTTSSAMAERLCELGDFKGWVTLRLNFRSKGYILRQYPWTVRQRNNFAAGSFHTKKLCSRLYSIEVEFYLKNKNKKWLFSHHLGDLGGNVHTPSIARSKAKGRLPIWHDEVFSLSLTVET